MTPEQALHDNPTRPAVEHRTEYWVQAPNTQAAMDGAWLIHRKLTGRTSYYDRTVIAATKADGRRGWVVGIIEYLEDAA